MKRWAKWLLAIAVVIAILLVAMPQLLSSRVVKNRIAAQLTEVTGRKVTLSGRSSVSLRPYLGVTYSDARIASSAGGTGAPLASVEELRVQLSIASAFWGDAEISNVVLVRPRFNLNVDANGARNWQLQEGEFAKRLSAPDNEPTQSLKLGAAQIEDGTIKFNDQLNRVTAELTAVNGSIDWNDITSPLNSNLTAVWNGEIISLELAADSPLALLRGGISRTRAAIKSKALTMVFDGKIDTKLNTANGTFSSVSPSMKSAADWLSIEFPLANITTEFQLAGEINAAEDKITLENAKVSIAKHDGVGQLQFFSKSDALPTISGTLAFETLEVPTLPHLVFGGVRSDEQIGQLDLSKLQSINMDVGVSAKSITVGSVTATNVAASLMLRKGALRFEVGNADALSGTVSGFLDGQPQAGAFEFRSNLSLIKVDLEQMSSLVSGTAKGLTGTGNAEVKLNTKIASGSAKPLNLSGELQIKSTDGVINGIDLKAVYDLSNQDEETPVQYVDGVTGYDSLQLNFLIVRNTAFLRESELLNPSIKATLTGRSELNEGTLAMRGNIEGIEADVPSLPLPFFIGGTVSSPLFVPLPRPSSN